jgi:DNA primase
VEQQLCYLVEGYTDVISLHQAGITNVVASSGTSLTEDQVRLIKRYAPTVSILYDGDAAGMKASLRGIDLILKEGPQREGGHLPRGRGSGQLREEPQQQRGHRTPHRQRAGLPGLQGRTLLVQDVGDDPVKKAAAIHEIVESVALVPDLVLRIALHAAMQPPVADQRAGADQRDEQGAAQAVPQEARR